MHTNILFTGKWISVSCQIKRNVTVFTITENEISFAVLKNKNIKMWRIIFHLHVEKCK